MAGTRIKIWVYALGWFAVYYAHFPISVIIPGIRTTPLRFYLVLSLLVVLPLLVLLALWVAVRFVLAKWRKHPLGPWSTISGQIAVSGISMFLAFIVLTRSLPIPLPSGSYDKPFDRAVWLEAESTNHVPGNITPRQQMLADLVKQLSGKSRAELETMLGPSLNTDYFQDTGRDLIYMTGPQRDSFFVVDSEWLLIWVDQNDRYQRYSVFSD